MPYIPDSADVQVPSYFMKPVIQYYATNEMLSALLSRVSFMIYQVITDPRLAIGYT